jgi:hypothetical protein
MSLTLKIASMEETEKGNNNQNEHNTLFDYFEIISGGL